MTAAGVRKIKSEAQLGRLKEQATGWLGSWEAAGNKGLLRWCSGTESTCKCRRCGFDPWVRKVPWRRKWQPTAVFFPGKLHRQGRLVGYSPWGCKESDTTK